MRFQLLELILADQVPTTVTAHIGRSTDRSTPPAVACNVQEWQFCIYTDRAHIGRSPGTSNPQ